MPYRIWRHWCAVDGREVGTGVPVCTFCGIEGVAAGWGLSGIEMMGRYQERTGLKAIGPHRRWADEQLAGAFTRCDACGGSGFVDQPGTEERGECSACESNGVLRIWSFDRIDEARRRVLERFPDAVVEAHIPGSG